MATSDVIGNLESMDSKLSSSTLKRHPNMELKKADLLRLLSYLEGELQARDITIAALKTEKSKRMIYQAKYNRYGLGDPFFALNRDTDGQKDSSFDSKAAKALYADQLAQLENLIATQRKAQLRMREQLAAVEKRYHKVLTELDEEKKKHALDTAQGDDVTYLLEKERERLKQELDFEKSHNKKVDKEMKKTLVNLEDEKSKSAKHKEVAIMLIKERKQLSSKIAELSHRNALNEEKMKLKSVIEGLSNESQLQLHVEAAMEKQMSEWDIEREQFKAKLRKEEAMNHEQSAVIDQLKHEIDCLKKEDSIPLLKEDDISLSDVTKLDFLGSEMADLHKLLQSMETGDSNNDNTLPCVNSMSSSDDDLKKILSHLEDESKTKTNLLSYSEKDDMSAIQLDADNYLIKCAAAGSIDNLFDLIINRGVDINECDADGLTALHAASENGHDSCVQFLIDKGADIKSKRSDGSTPTHLAASEGYYSCLVYLLKSGANINQQDKSGWTPLYCAATNGHKDCCRLLLDHHASLDSRTTNNWTPVHTAIYFGHVQCLDVLLGYKSKKTKQIDGIVNARHQEAVHNICKMADKDGWTVAHLAAIKENKDCLERLLEYCDIDLEMKDKWNRSVSEVASLKCKEFIQGLGKGSEIICKIVIQVEKDCKDFFMNKNSEESRVSSFTIATLKVTSGTSWTALGHLINGAFGSHILQVSIGIKPKKNSKSILQSSSEDFSMPYSLGLSTDSIKQLAIGDFQWSTNEYVESSPYEVLCKNDTHVIDITLKGIKDGCFDMVAYETLISISMLQNYNRCIEQYRSVIFYGAAGMGKSFIAGKLAEYIKVKESKEEKQCEIHVIQMVESLTHFNLIELLIKLECIYPESRASDPNKISILLLENIHLISVSEVFGDLVKLIESRNNSFPLKFGSENGIAVKEGMFFMPKDVFIIGTMDKSKSSCLQLSIQQRFRWIQFRNDIEPIKHLLHRHLYRKVLNYYQGKLPSNDDSIYNAIEWIILVWQKLNDEFTELKLNELIFGPVEFLKCPLEPNDFNLFYQWLSDFWNKNIVPAVASLVKQDADPLLGPQEAVINTTLCVLKQRAIVSGCPLSGQEKERYLSKFNEYFHGEIDSLFLNHTEEIPSQDVKETGGLLSDLNSNNNNSCSNDGSLSPSVFISIPEDYISNSVDKVQSRMVKSCSENNLKNIKLNKEYKTKQDIKKRPPREGINHERFFKTISDSKNTNNKIINQSLLKDEFNLIRDPKIMKLISNSKIGRAMSPDPLLSHAAKIPINPRRAFSPCPVNNTSLNEQLKRQRDALNDILKYN